MRIEDLVVHSPRAMRGGPSPDRDFLCGYGRCRIIAQAVVVGGGIIGLMAAYALHKRGLEVTVLERGEAGMACSYGNAGFICPSLSSPLPAPGLVGQSLRWMLQASSPLHIRPASALRLSPWLIDFWRHCNQEDFDRGYDAMLALNRRTMALWDALAADGVRHEGYREGLLFAFTDEHALRCELKELQQVTAYGMPEPRVLDRAQVHKEEPNLAERVVGGILLPGEGHVEPSSLSLGLLAKLWDMGVHVREHVEVQGFERRTGDVRAVLTDQGPVPCDLVVLAAGVWTKSLAVLVGGRLPLEAGKGYSITYRESNLTFRRPIYFAGTKAVLTPFDGTVRIAGTLEFSGENLRIIRRRVAALRAAVHLHLREELRGAGEVVWTGMRPMLPDGLPAIGRIGKVGNVFVSTGHAANGIFMAPTSAELLADLVVDGGSAIDARPFAPERFA